MTDNKDVITKTKTKGIMCTLLGDIYWGFSGTCGQYLFIYKNMESGWLTMVRMNRYSHGIYFISKRNQ